MKRTLSAPARVSSAAGAVGLEIGFDNDLAPAARRWNVDVPELLARATIVVAFSFLAVRFGAHFMETGKITGLMLLASEALVVVLTVFRRTTGIVDRSLRARVITTAALIGPLMLIPKVDAALLPEVATATLTAAGVLVVIVGKASLGRSFGLLPANRGVVCTGMYRVVRHPIYMGYLLSHIGFLAANLSTWNIVILVCGDVALMVRAVCEEHVLAQDPAYRDYLAKVRWRVAPGIF